MWWRAIHVTVALNWLTLLWVTLMEVFKQGDLPLAASEAGHFQTSFVLYMVVILALTGASAIRAAWMED